MPLPPNKSDMPLLSPLESTVQLGAPLKLERCYQMGRQTSRTLLGFPFDAVKRDVSLRVYLDGDLWHQTTHAYHVGNSGYVHPGDGVPSLLRRPNMTSWGIDRDGWLCAMLDSTEDAWPVLRLHRQDICTPVTTRQMQSQGHMQKKKKRQLQDVYDAADAHDAADALASLSEDRGSSSPSSSCHDVHDAAGVLASMSPSMRFSSSVA